MSNSTTNLSLEITDIIESVEAVNDIQNIINDVTDPRKLAVLRTENNKTEQKGGLTILTVFQACIMPIFYLIGIIIRVIVGIFQELFFISTKQNPNRAKFWKYLWFCIKCGFYLCIFAIAGPIFILIGISMVYRKLMKKMGISAVDLVRDRISSVREIS
jgi:hypothetical protein